MEMHQIRYFLAVCDHGSFTRAAERLTTDKARVSRAISQLEKKLGVRLLERSTRALHLTEIGREVYERAVGILDALQETERVAQQMVTEPVGTLKLTCGVEFGMLAVSRWIDGYLARYPQMSVEADFTARLVDLVHEGFDLAIRVGPLEESRLAARRLGELHYGLTAAPDYLARRGTPTRPDELSQHDLLVFSTASHRAGWRLQRGAEQILIDTPPRMRINNSFAVRDAALAGLGIAQLPLQVAAAALANGSLVRLLPEWAPLPVPVHAVFPSNRYLTAKVRAFVEYAGRVF